MILYVKFQSQNFEYAWKIYLKYFILIQLQLVTHMFFIIW